MPSSPLFSLKDKLMMIAMPFIMLGMLGIIGYVLVRLAQTGVDIHG